MKKRLIVVSAINLASGGALTVLRECLAYLSTSELLNQYRVIALVHDRNLADFPNIEYLEFPKSKRSWINRLYYEYVYFWRLSRKLTPFLWFSLHDITPNVRAQRRAVYMHNPSCFYKIGSRDIKFDKTYILFALFYKYLYRINIRKNHWCVVQQSWFRDVIPEMFRVGKEKVIVAKPVDIKVGERAEIKPCRRFFFPSLARPFKNFETVCEAVKILNADGGENFSIALSIDGTENKYSKWVYDKYRDVAHIEFCGLIPYEEMEQTYEECDSLIFPSRLETWGLPVSEFAKYGRPMIVADLPYAHETAEGSMATAFFDPDDAVALARLMRLAMKGDFTDFRPVARTALEKPFARNWCEMFEILLCSTPVLK